MGCSFCRSRDQIVWVKELVAKLRSAARMQPRACQPWVMVQLGQAQKGRKKPAKTVCTIGSSTKVRISTCRALLESAQDHAVSPLFTRGLDGCAVFLHRHGPRCAAGYCFQSSDRQQRSLPNPDSDEWNRGAANPDRLVSGTTYC